MGEVGNQGPQFHAEVGAAARAAGIEQLMALGTLSRHTVQAYGPTGRHFEDMAALVGAVQGTLPAVGRVLVKGSRSMKMEQVVQALEARTEQAPGAHGAPHGTQAQGEAAC